MGLKTVVLNSERMNYDGKLDLSVLSSQVKEYASTEPDQILERVQGMDVVVTKEMPVCGDIIARFPDSVQLICEAGTGYNNIDIEAARARGIAVCNIPAYSTERVAHTAIMMILNLSSSMQIQQAMLARGDRSNFTKCMQVSHVEVNGKILGVIGAGNIGREVIKVAQALGMKVLAYDLYPNDSGKAIAEYVDLDTLLAQSDVVFLHCNLTADNEKMINKANIAMETSRLALEEQQTTLYTTIESYWIQAVNNQAKYKSALANTESQQTSYELLSEQFRLGLKNITELREAKENLLVAQQNELQSKYLALYNMQMLNFYYGK